MFDYHYGVSTKKFKQDIDLIRPKLTVRHTAGCKPVVLFLGYMHGLDALSFSLVSKTWYSASWDFNLWKTLSENIGKPDRIEVLEQSSESKIRIYEKKSRKNDMSELVLNNDVKSAIKWKLVYGQLLYNTCSQCLVQENKLRFLPILQRSLCFPCAKLPIYTMTSLENAELDYNISRKHIDEYQIEGLRVPDPNNTGKFMLVYYVKDILNLKSIVDKKKKENSTVRTEFQEKRRTEIIYNLKKVGIDDNFITMCLENEGSLAYNYILGKSKMSICKIASKILEKYEKWKDIDPDEENLPEPEVILPLKRPRLILTQEEKLRRKIELIDRLVIMGINTDDIGLDDPESIAVAYIEGRTKEELGPVAGSIWRDHKPVFTGVSIRKARELNEKSSNASESD